MLMKIIAMLLSLLLMAGWILDQKEADELWAKGNSYYQLELYEKAIPCFKEALDIYIQDDDKVMITISQICLAYSHYVMAEEELAKRYLYDINWNYKVEDYQWNNSIADMFGFFGDNLNEVRYLRRASKYDKDR
jgi:tetratricopeptide (TPR) repeat protein